MKKIKTSKKKEPMKYDIFLKSKIWKDKKMSFLSILKEAKIKNLCFFCESKTHRNVHHLNYIDNLGDEKFYNLFILCKDCHKDVHNYQKINNCSVEEATLKYCELCNFDYIKYKNLLLNIKINKNVILTKEEKKFIEYSFSFLPKLDSRSSKILLRIADKLCLSF